MTRLLGLARSRPAIRLCDWSHAERLAPDETWQPASDTMPNERMRPLVLRRQLAAVAAMTRGEPHPLAILADGNAIEYWPRSAGQFWPTPRPSTYGHSDGSGDLFVDWSRLLATGTTNSRFRAIAGSED
jgi:hypothetical protein